MHGKVDRDEVPRHPHLVEPEARHAIDLGIDPRVVVTEEADARTHATDEVVQSRRLARPVRWYAGVIPGTGNHWLSWIHIDDLIRLLLSALENGRYAGAINATAPEPVRYDDFYSLLAHSLHRPIWMHVPASVVKAGLGEMSQLLLTGQRVLPRRAQELGFEFRYATAAGALRAIYGH